MWEGAAVRGRDVRGGTLIWPHRQLWGLAAVGDGLHVEVDEPDQRVLVHWLDVCQVRDAEEQDGGV